MATDEKVECPLCGFRTWSTTSMERHQKKRHEPCPHCDRSFIKLDMHIRQAHPAEGGE